jgi:hypothetical protein
VVFGQRTQKIAIALGIGIFLLLAIAYFWQGNTKYLALGVLTGYLLPHIYSLVQEQENIIIFRHSYDSDDDEER